MTEKNKYIDILLLVSILTALFRIVITDSIFEFMFQVFYPSFGSILFLLFVLNLKLKPFCEYLSKAIMIIIMYEFPILLLSLIKMSLIKAEMVIVMALYYLLITLLLRKLCVIFSIGVSAVYIVLFEMTVFMSLYFNNYDLWSFRRLVILLCGALLMMNIKAGDKTDE